MTYQEAISIANHQINIKLKEAEVLKECVRYLSNEQNSNDSLTQSPEKILENFGVRIH